MTTEDHFDSAIRDLERAKATFRADPAFALARIGDARMAITAAKVDIAHPADPLTRKIVKGPIAAAA